MEDKVSGESYSLSLEEEVRKEEVCCQDKGCGQWVHHGLSVQRQALGLCLPCRIDHSFGKNLPPQLSGNF